MCGIKKLKIPFPFKLLMSKSGKEKRLEFGEMYNFDAKIKEPNPKFQPRKSAFKNVNPEASSSNNYSGRESKKHVRFSQLDLSMVDDGGYKKNYGSPLPSARRHVEDG